MQGHLDKKKLLHDVIHLFLIEIFIVKISVWNRKLSKIEFDLVKWTETTLIEIGPFNRESSNFWIYLETCSAATEF